MVFLTLKDQAFDKHIRLLSRRRTILDINCTNNGDNAPIKSDEQFDVCLNGIWVTRFNGVCSIPIEIQPFEIDLFQKDLICLNQT